MGANIQTLSLWCGPAPLVYGTFPQHIVLIHVLMVSAERCLCIDDEDAFVFEAAVARQRRP